LGDIDDCFVWSGDKVSQNNFKVMQNVEMLNEIHNLATKFTKKQLENHICRLVLNNGTK